MAMTQAPHCKHHFVGMKRGAGDGAAFSGGEEGRVRVDSVYLVAVDVEDGEGVGVGAAVK